jgi:hypothetical protein
MYFQSQQMIWEELTEYSTESAQVMPTQSDFGLLEYLVHNMTHKMQCAVLHVWLLVCL